MTLSLRTYWMGRDKQFPKELTDEIRADAGNTVSRINRLVELYCAATNEPAPTIWASGWRPNGVNSKTANAAKGSTHLTARGGDVRDTKRRFARWCYANPNLLEECGLWMEDPRWTPTWVHLQTVPPRSGKRIYIPSTKPPLAPLP